MKRRILNLLIALDQLLFCICTAGHSKPVDTFSAAAYRLEQNGQWAGKFFRPVIDFFFFFDPGHCQRAYENLMAGKHLPAKLKGASE